MPASRSGAAGGGTTGTTDRTVTMTPAVGDHVLVFCSVGGNTQSAPTMSDNNADGIGYTLLAALAWGSASGNRLFAFVRNGLMVNTTSTIITLDTDTNDAAHMWVHQASGAVRAGADSIRQIATIENGAAAGTPAVTFASSHLTHDLNVCAVASANSMTPPTSWTEQVDQSQTVPTTFIEGCTRQTGFTGTTVTWGSTSASTFAAIAVEFSDVGPIAGDVAVAATLSGTVTAPGAFIGDVAVAAAFVVELTVGDFAGTCAASAVFAVAMSAPGAVIAACDTLAAYAATFDGSGALAGTCAASVALVAVFGGSGEIAGALVTASTWSAAFTGPAVDDSYAGACVTGAVFAATFTGRGAFVGGLVAGAAFEWAPSDPEIGAATVNVLVASQYTLQVRTASTYRVRVSA